MEKKWIVGNWKMHGSNALAAELVSAAVGAKTQRAEVVICPPFTLLAGVHGLIRGKGLHLGGQDCHQAVEGAYTGDTSAAMLVEAGCGYVILGHSERRTQHQETDALIRAKCEAALAAGLKVILCVGESLTEREAGKAESVVATQLKDCMPASATTGNLLLAYEPVWAIGTGKTASLGDIEQMHRFIGAKAKGFTVLYGGSVKPGNAKEIMSVPGVGGVLVGGASVEPQSFAAIIGAAG